MRALELTGKRFGFMTVIGRAGSNASGKAIWTMLCDCGRTFVIAGHELTRKTRKAQQSCGCKRGELISAALTTHGMSRHPAFFVWGSMRDRCRLPSHQAWSNYGGRGIRVCEAWEDFEQFWKDMGPTYAEGLSLDRIDNDGNYGPDNCRWVTVLVQNNNRRDNHYIQTPAGRMTVTQAARHFGFAEDTLRCRLRAGWSVHDALSKPVRKSSK